MKKLLFVIVVFLFTLFGWILYNKGIVIGMEVDKYNCPQTENELLKRFIREDYKNIYR